MKLFFRYPLPLPGREVRAAYRGHFCADHSYGSMRMTPSIPGTLPGDAGERWMLPETAEAHANNCARPLMRRREAAGHGSTLCLT